MHLFRKYLDNRGSALFMVISTMTAVMISCMAMYFSVISSRSAQYAVFNQQQSKQSAVSISDAVLAGLMDGKVPALQTMLEDMWKLNVGDKITTEGNGFAAFDSSATGEDDPNIGSYMVEITRVSENTFDIIVTTSVNGVNDVYHTVIDIEATEAAKAPPAPTQVFAATGYVPNDVFLDGGRFITDVFFDNEQTIVNAYGGKNMELWGDLATGGSLTCHAYLIPRDNKAQTFAIRNRYIANFNGSVNFSKTAEKSTVLVGGDCIINQQGGFDNALVYTLGNWYAFANGMDNSIHFVNGNVYLHKDISGKAANFYTNGKIYLVDGGSSVNDLKIVGEVSPKGKWDAEIKNVNKDYLTVSEMITTLDEKTASNQYYKWVINDNKPTGDKYVKELNEAAGTAVHKTLKFNQSDYTNPIPTIILKYGENGEHGCIIDDVTSDNGNQFVNTTLIIDTGEDEDNVYTIRVKPNRDFDKDNVPETFSWYPYEKSSTATYMSILVKGRGSVVVDIPEGVTYQDMDRVKFIHYGWFLLGGGTIDTGRYGGIYTERYNSDGGYWESSAIYDARKIDDGTILGKPDMTFENFIHKDCKSGDGCIYTKSESENKCEIHTDKNMTVVTCQKEITLVGGGKKKVDLHGVVDEYCEECHKDKKLEGLCKNHVGRKEIDDFLKSKQTTNPDGTVIKSGLELEMTGSDGEIIYPTTNIFLVSCDESASIRLSILKDGTNIIQNSFFGYIYAPYMTFKAYGNNAGGGMVRLFGGMTVSDYVIDDSMSVIACWPEKMPNDLMSEDCLKNKLEGFASKSWKISLNGH